MKKLEEIHVLEIGYNSIFREVGCRDTFVDLAMVGRGEPLMQRLRGLFGNLKRARSLCKSGEFDVLIVREMGRFIWRRDANFVVNLLRWFVGIYLVRCVRLVARRGLPIGVVDMTDEGVLDPRDEKMLELCQFYFKRELSTGQYNLMARLGDQHQELSQKMLSEEMVARCAKMRPLSLGYITGAPKKRVDEQESHFREICADDKCYDLFFYGGIEHSFARREGFPLLKQLEREGVRVCFLEKGTSIEEYWEKISQSWLTWSPEGLGWDTLRHYESALLQSIPLMNAPSILRHRPLEEGVHGYYYQVEGDGLIRKVLEVLQDREKLLKMCRAARSHVLEHHTPKARGIYILETLLNRKFEI